VLIDFLTGRLCSLCKGSAILLGSSDKKRMVVLVGSLMAGCRFVLVSTFHVVELADDGHSVLEQDAL
jgi:hypothetical protein